MNRDLQGTGAAGSPRLPQAWRNGAGRKTLFIT